MTEIAGKVRLYMSVSIDGFITGPDDGQGRRLFDGLPTDQVELELMRSREGSGVLHLRYRVIGGGRS